MNGHARRQGRQQEPRARQVKSIHDRKSARRRERERGEEAEKETREHRHRTLWEKARGDLNTHARWRELVCEFMTQRSATVPVFTV